MQNVDFQQTLFGMKGSDVKEPVDFYEDAFLLIDKMRNKEIDGLVLDRYTLWHLKITSAAILSGKWKSELFSIDKVSLFAVKE